MSRLPVALVEHHEMFADTLDLALTLHGHEVKRVAVPDRASPAESLVAPVLATRARVVLLDVDLDLVGNVVDVIEPLARSLVAVVALTASRDQARWGECLHRGARRVIPKTASLQAVIGTLRRIENGLPVCQPDRRQALIAAWQRERAAHERAHDRLATLTRREQEILAHLSLGRQVREIADHHVVSEATVRTQVKSILSKLDVGSQIAAVGLAYRFRWGAPQFQ
jgi:DNA-binding NarL/FixJ family response regulator